MIASAPASWQSRQRASYESSAPTTIVSPEYGRRPAVDEALRRRGRAAAAVADRLQLVDELGVREQLGHDAERQPAEVLVEPRDDDPDAAVGERERRVDDRAVEELHLVDADDVVAGGAGDELRHALDGDGAHARPGVRDDVGRVVPVVDARLEDDDPLPGDLGPAQAPDHLLALAREHRPADHLEPAAALGGNANHGARGYYRYRSDRAFALRDGERRCAGRPGGEGWPTCASPSSPRAPPPPTRRSPRSAATAPTGAC